MIELLCKKDKAKLREEMAAMGETFLTYADKEELQQSIKRGIETKFDGAFVENGYLYFTINGEVPEGFEALPVGKNISGSSDNNAVMTVSNTSGWNSLTVSDADDVIFTFSWSSVEEDYQTGNGTMTLKVNGATKSTKTIEQGTIGVNLKDYLAIGSNVVRVTVSDTYGNTRTLALDVTVIQYSLTSTFDDSVVYTGDITFPFVPTGSGTKTMQFVLDGTLIGSRTITASGRQQSYTIPFQSHGAHSFETYFTATVNDNTIESNHLYYEVMFVESGNTTPIIASSFNLTKMSQYYTITIPYMVYTPDSLTSEISLCVNGEMVNTLTVDRTKHSWTYRADAVGDVLLEIVCGDVKKSFTVSVSETDIDVEAEENDLDLYLTSYGRSNNEENPSAWSYGTVETQLEGFNFVSDGWQTDEDGNTVLRVTGDARVTIPLNVFGNDFRTTGKTIEFEFATRNVLNYETELISCMTGGKGIVFTPQQVTLASEQSTITAQYKEDEHVRVSFVIEKKTENRLIHIYIDGILSRTIQYPEADDFQQAAPVGITIGSNDCTIDLHCIRIYSNSLTRYQMLDNWIADTQNGYDMLSRYSHNNIYDDYGQIVIKNLPSDLPYLVLEASALPQYKGDKKTVSGYYVDPLDSTKSFTFEGASCDVQGTSSQYYARKNYKIKFSNGFTDNDGETSSTYQLRADSIPVKTFTFKADVASSEGANNVELVKLWEDICPYKTPPQEEDENVRQGIDGFPIVVFWSNGTDTTFLGKYNFNNDKGTEEVFGFTEGDESWEIRNNTSDRSMFKSADFSGTAWLEDFEGRYPDGNTDATNLQKLAEWLVSTDQAQATDEALDEAVTYGGVEYTTDSAAYRLAKFKAEAEDWFEMDSIVFSYIFTELFLLVDSRAKNNFPTIYKDGKWCVLPYDMDTAIGTNNEGLLVFDYNLEDTDTVNGANVYNGQDSVIYINTRDAFADRIEEMYGELRSSGLLSYDLVEQRFEDHQALWSEAIFNEDAYYKYIQPLTDDGEATYLSMLQGSKKAQRKWWLFNRFRYIDSKYTCGDALTSTITLRAYQKSDFEITPYADIYPCVAFDSTKVKVRGKRNEVCAVNSPETWNPNGSDAVVTVYSADQLRDIGDISAFKVGYADFSKATKIQRIKAGDSATDYSNPNMTEFYAGNNTLLKLVDLRNCPNLSGTIELSGCPNIEEVYLDGTAVTSVSLPNGGMMKTLHLPDTITNLTLMNQPKLTDFVFSSHANITTLRLENVGNVLDSLAIVQSMASGNRIRIIGFDWTFDSSDALDEFISIVEGMRGLDAYGNNTDKAQLQGTITVDTISSKLLYLLQTNYPSITVNYNTATTYTVTFYVGEEAIQTTAGVLYGESVEYAGETPVYDESNPDDWLFTGWSPSPDFVEGDMDCYAQFKFVGSNARKLLQRTLSGAYVNDRVTSIGTYAFYGCTALTSADFHAVTSIGAYAFYGCSKLESLILRSEEVCTLSATNALTSTLIAKGTGYIYVPSALVETYQSATNWATYSAQFRAIEDYDI